MSATQSPPGAATPSPDASGEREQAPAPSSGGAGEPPASSRPRRVVPRRPTLRDAFRFFLPLMLMAELMMISHAIISAFLARMSDPEPILAAYSIAFYFHATLGSPIWACQFVAVSYIRDFPSTRRMFYFCLQVAAIITVAWLVVGLTPVGDWLFSTLFGASPDVVRAAKNCTVIFTLMVLFSVLRTIAYGLFMVERRTILVTLGTVVRLAALAAVLAGASLFFEGAEVGALALAACIAVETIYACWAARPFFRRLKPTGRTPGYRELWKFSWPIMVMQVAETGVVFTVNLFLGRLARPELALAAFGILDSVMRVILSPLRNVIQTVQTHVRFRRDIGPIAVFATIVGVAFAGIMLAFHSQWVRDRVLEDVMGLPPHMADYVAPAMGLGFLLAATMAGASLARGLLIVAKRTGVIALASGVRLVAVAAIATTALVLGEENGALIGMWALIGAFFAEALILGARLVWLDRRRPRPRRNALARRAGASG